MPNTFTRSSPTESTALWGGALARMTSQDDIWLGIPIGHQTANAQFGTSADPDTSYSVVTTADDLLGVIWRPLSTIKVTNCKILWGEGGTTNITHKVCLMRYDMDADGDLTNGHKVGGTLTALTSDDYSQLRQLSPAIDSDNSVTSSQVLIAMIMCVTNVNATVTAKCIIEYTQFR